MEVRRGERAGEKGGRDVMVPRERLGENPTPIPQQQRGATSRTYTVALIFNETKPQVRESLRSHRTISILSGVRVAVLEAL
jgi:hypothetical protein